ncbi:hypothetical protein [Hominenteromicrobium sp.]|uniref:hypothetical protein n=1 Tax=Hominenteromicrobium sp. TaxID=3073581 RepID=UPI003AB4E8CD
MKAVIIAGATVAAVLLGLFAAGLFRLLWLSVPYETWLEYEREKEQRKGPENSAGSAEREEISMGKITITEKQEAIIRRLNDPLYTVEFLKEWVNRNDNVFINAPAALQAMGASGFFAAVRAIEQAEESDGENT